VLGLVLVASDWDLDGFRRVQGGVCTPVCCREGFESPRDSLLIQGRKLIECKGENSLDDWAKIVDCGDAPLTFLDNTVALKQLEKAHKVRWPLIIVYT